METKEVRGVKILLPSREESAITVWPFANPLEGEKITNSDFRNVDLSSHRWQQVTLSRVSFVDSRMAGLTVEDATLSDVLFQDCQFEYASLIGIRTKGSVAFVNCRFRESVFMGGDLGRAVFDACSFSGAELDSVKMVGTDIRECDISGISGVLSMKGVHVTPSQLPELFETVAKELDLKVSEVK